MQYTSTALPQSSISTSDTILESVRNKPKSSERTAALLSVAESLLVEERFVNTVHIARELLSQEPYLSEEIQTRVQEILDQARKPLLDITKEDFRAHHESVMAGLPGDAREELEKFLNENDTDSCRYWGTSYTFYKNDSSWFFIPYGQMMESFGDPIDYAIAKSSPEEMVAFVERLAEQSVVVYGSDGVVCTLGDERAFSYAEKIYEHTTSTEFKQSFERALVGVLFSKLAQPILPQETIEKSLIEQAERTFQRDERLLRDIAQQNHMRANYNREGYYDKPENFWMYGYAVRTNFFSEKQAKAISQELVDTNWNFDKISEETKELFGQFVLKFTKEHISEHRAKSAWEQQLERIHALVGSVIALSKKYPQFKEAVYAKLLSHHDDTGHFPDRTFNRYYYQYNPSHTLLKALQALQPPYELHNFWIEKIRSAESSSNAFLAFGGLVRAAPFGNERDAYIVDGIAAIEERMSRGVSDEIDLDWRKMFLYRDYTYHHLVSDEMRIPVRSGGEPLKIMVVEKQNRISENEVVCTVKIYSAKGIEERDAIYYVDQKSFREPEFEMLKNGLRTDD